MGSTLMLFSIGASSASAYIPVMPVSPMPPVSFNCHIVKSCGVYVDDSAPAGGDGTSIKPFKKITDAVDFLKDAANTDYNNIWVAGGTYSNETLPWSLDGATYSKNFYIQGGWNSAFSANDISATPSKIKTGGNSLLSLNSVGGRIEGLDVSGVNDPDGGVLVKNQGATTLSFSALNNVFHDNVTPNAVGLAILITGSNTASVSGNKFYSNTADGGLVSNYNGKVTVSNNLYYANSAGGNGGSLKCSNGAVVYNNFILGDTADALAITGGSCQFLNNTLAHNQINSGSSNGVIVASNGANVIDNNVLAYNVGNSTLVHSSGDTSTFDFNALFNNASDPSMTGGNLNCDPKFSGSGNDPDSYKLGSGSTCIDKGTAESTVAKDYFGTTRPVDGNGNGTAEYDPGAFEAGAATVAAPSITGLGVAPASFSPNGDGTNDSTSISFNLNADANVSVSILNSSSVEMKKLLDNQSKTAGSVLVNWDGKDSTNNVVADAKYTVKVTATNGAGTDTKSTDVMVNITGNPNPPASQCAGFTDVASSDERCAAITYVKGIGAMTGNPDGTFAPSGVLQRDQIAKIALETFNKYVDGTDYCGGSAAFPDVTGSAWSYQYICRGKSLGIITGYLSGADAGFYRPARSVNRVEFLAIVLRNLTDAMPATSSTSYSDVATGQWFSGYARYSMDNALFIGSNLFPTQATTRGEVASVIYKLHTLGKI